ncbi:MAG: DUF401 family protein [Nitrospirota bacterium]
MIDLVKIGSVFLIIVLLLRFRWNLGLVMFIGSILLGTLYLLDPLRQATVILKASVDLETLNLIAGLLFIMVLENIIRKRGVLKRMMEAVVNVAQDRRIAMAVLPAVIGLLPSAGGAVFSAPMVQEAAATVAVTPERKAFINYWFRHIWEYVSPLYPGAILAAAIMQISLSQFLLFQVPFSIAVVAVGALLGFRGIPESSIEGKRDAQEFKALAATMIPILASVILVVVFKIPLAFSMAAVVIALLFFYRYSFRDMKTTLQESISWNMTLMVVGIMIFKGMLDATGSIEALPPFFKASGLPSEVVLFALPFFAGLLTGHTVGYVGSTFPILVAMLGGQADVPSMAFAFASGFAGVMLSPTHLCFVLTVKYFKADMAVMYRLLWLPVSLVFLVALIRLWV